MPKPAVFGPIPSVPTPAYRGGSTAPLSAVVPRSRGVTTLSQQQAVRRLILDSATVGGSFDQLEIEGEGATVENLGNGRVKITIEGGGGGGGGELGLSPVTVIDGTNTLSAEDAARGMIDLNGEPTADFEVEFPAVAANETDAYYRIVKNNTGFTAEVISGDGDTYLLGAGLSQILKFTEDGVENAVTGI